MIREAEVKAAQLMNNASATAAAAASTKSNDALVAAEEARVEEARQTAATKIDEIQAQMRACIQALDRIKAANQPDAPAADPKAAADAVADEISKNLENLVGTTVDTAPKAAPKHPTNDTTTSKFANLQFGRNYDHK
jgi:hypothetical protein